MHAQWSDEQVHDVAIIEPQSMPHIVAGIWIEQHGLPFAGGCIGQSIGVGSQQVHIISGATQTHFVEP